MQLSVAAFLFAFAGFYLGLAAYLILRGLVSWRRFRKQTGEERPGPGGSG